MHEWAAALLLTVERRLDGNFFQMIRYGAAEAQGSWRDADRIDREPWKSGLVGLAAQVLFFPVLLVVFIVLMISIVGIPLALLLVPASLLALLVLLLLGYAGVALFAGRRLGERVGLEWYSPFLALLLGVLLIQGWSILGEALGFVGGPPRAIS